MRKIVLALSLPLFALILYPILPKSPDITPSEWQEDLAYFKEQMVKNHKNVFHHITEAEYYSDIAKLHQDIPSLKDYQIIVRLEMITARIGDGHTSVHLQGGFKRYPIVVTWFGDEL